MKTFKYIVTGLVLSPFLVSGICVGAAIVALALALWAVGAIGMLAAGSSVEVASWCGIFTPEESKTWWGENVERWISILFGDK